MSHIIFYEHVVYIYVSYEIDALFLADTVEYELHNIYMYVPYKINLTRTA